MVCSDVEIVKMQYTPTSGVLNRDFSGPVIVDEKCSFDSLLGHDRWMDIALQLAYIVKSIAEKIKPLYYEQSIGFFWNGGDGLVWPDVIWIVDNGKNVVVGDYITAKWCFAKSPEDYKRED